MLLLTIAALIPPPPDWTPPRASGPGTFCGATFRLAMQQGETIRADWPGEVFINDVFGTYRLTTPGGEIVITENGPRTVPAGRPVMVRAGETTFRAHQDGVYALRVRGNQNIKAVTVRFPSGTSEAAARALLSRVSAGTPAGATCLEPENR